MRSSALLGRQHIHAAAPTRCSAARRTLASTGSIARSKAAALLRSSTGRTQSSSSQRSSRGRTAAVRVAASLDYVATASDEGVLKLPARTELDPEEIKNVFAFPRYVYMHLQWGCLQGPGGMGPQAAVSQALQCW